MKNERRITVSNNELLPFTEKDVSKTYYQVKVGGYGVVLPKTINLDTLDGLQLIDGKGSSIHDLQLAEKIAEKTGGKLLEVTEKFIRIIEEVSK